MLSIIIPTYQEVENLFLISSEINKFLKNQEYEILFMDDNSNDGSKLECDLLSQNFPVRMVVRTENRGLSYSVIDGIKLAKGKYIVVMDADLSHPASEILKMIELLKSGMADFVLGSRYIHGGKTDDKWSFTRYINSRIATLMALPLVPVRDPMSGFFAFKQEDFPLPYKLSPIGYKIALEIMVKGDFKAIVEHPIFFKDREFGCSKLNLREQIKYLRHIRRLYIHKFPKKIEFIQFAIVGSTGMALDIFFYLVLQYLFGFSHLYARGFSFWPAVSWNWFWNRTLTFGSRPKKMKFRQWLYFSISSMLGFSISFSTYYLLTTNVVFFVNFRLAGLLVGILLGFVSNFILSNLFIFKKIQV